jgi:hypothetical protein
MDAPNKTFASRNVVEANSKLQLKMSQTHRLIAGKLLVQHPSSKSVFKKSNLASAVVVIVPENSHKTENENEDEEEAFN